MSRTRTTTPKPETMKIPLSCKIELAAAKKADNRFSTVHPRLMGGELVATDGRILALIPVELADDDTDGPIQKEAFREARRPLHKARGSDFTIVTANGQIGAGDQNQMAMLRPDDALDFPKIEPLRKYFDAPSGGPSRVRLALDVDLLKRLAGALGSNGVVLEFTPEDGAVTSPIRVTPTGTASCANPVTGARGLIMPLSGLPRGARR